MNIRNKESADRMETAASNGAARARETLTTVNTSIMKAVDQNRAIVQHVMRAMQEESLRFVNMRFEHTSKAIERSRDCQGLSGLITLHQDWLMDVARDYAELNKRFGEVFHEMAEHGAESMHELASEAVHAQKHEAKEERAAA